MRTEFGYAWGKLYLAMLCMATSTAPMPQRVVDAFRMHLSSLGRQNLPASMYERLAAVRAKLLVTPQDADDDLTFDPSAVSPKEAMAIAEEICSLYDEIARSDARDRAAGLAG
jgi:hypothetical protein